MPAVSFGQVPRATDVLPRYQKQHPLGEFVSHRYKRGGMHAAMQKSMEPGSMKVVMEPGVKRSWDGSLLG
jgi:hypothetical protein